jgi:hypothetical protein
MADRQSFADSGKLLSRVTSDIDRNKRVTFLFGSALTAPGSRPSEKGVPDANSMIQEVVHLFQGTEEYAALGEMLSNASPAARYQEAMQFVIDCRGQEVLNDLIHTSVLRARKDSQTSQTAATQLEMDTGGWYLTPAVEAVGQLVQENPHAFSAPLLTSNFDPLLEISIRHAGGHSETIVLAGDGQFMNVLSPQTKVVHFHGF